MKTKKFRIFPALALVFFLCSCGGEGTCILGEEGGCPPGAFCFGKGSFAKGSEGICVFGWAKKPKEEEVVVGATVKAWRLLLTDGREVFPVKREEAEASPFEKLPEAEWIGTGAAKIEAVVLGLEEGETLRAWTKEGVHAACKPEGNWEGGGAFWTCIFEEGWASGVEAEVEVNVQPAEGTQHTRIYPADTQAPLVSLLVLDGGKCRVGMGAPGRIGDDSCPRWQSCVGIGDDSRPLLGRCVDDCNESDKQCPSGVACRGGICDDEYCQPAFDICGHPPPPGTPICEQIRPTPRQPRKLSICAQAQDMGSGVSHMETSVPALANNDQALILDDGQRLEMGGWQKEMWQEGEVFLSCWSVVWTPLRTNGWNLSAFAQVAPPTFAMPVKVWDKMGNLLDAWAYASRTSNLLYPNNAGCRRSSFVGSEGYGCFPSAPLRLSCSAQAEGLSSNAVQMPLVWANGRLVFGSSLGEGASANDNSLYSFDTSTCKEPSRLHVGALQGPMVALGGSGRIALALGGGGPIGRGTPRLSVVHAFGPGFVFIRERDCRSYEEGGSGNAVFDKGLALMSWANADGTDTPTSTWRLAAPFQDKQGKESRLRAYAPNQRSTSSRPPCVDSSISAPFWTPMAQSPDGSMVGVSGSAEAGFQQSTWHFEPSVWNERSVVDMEGATPPAWVTLSAGSLWRRGALHTSPAAIDDEGRAYAVVKEQDGYALQRFAPNGLVVEDSTPPFPEAPVGSPILGDKAVYVVTTSGTVFAANVETLAFLWIESLGIRVSPTAQPVLSGKKLWIVGMRGEIRGVHVESNGLSPLAQWPKAFRDNCNTSSSLSTPDIFPSCF